MPRAVGGIFAVVVLSFVAFVADGCSAILGVTDVPTPSEGGAGGQCRQVGDACGDIVSRIPVDPGGGCCSGVCIVTSATEGHCGTAGTYAIAIDGVAGTVLGTSYQPPHGSDPGGYLAVAFSLPGVADPERNTYVAVDISKVETGCADNQVEYGPASGDVRNSSDRADCGLTVTRAPPAGVTGSFKGALTAANSISSVDFTFDQALQ